MPSQSRREAELRAKYDAIKTPSAVLAKVLKDRPKSSALYYAINRQVQHIYTRSSSWERGEVTIYDKALVRMHTEGMPLQNIGLLELFLDQYVCLGLCHSTKEEEATVHAFLTAHSIRKNNAGNELPDAFQDKADRDSKDDSITQENNSTCDSEAKDKVISGDFIEDVDILKNQDEAPDEKQLSPRKDASLENLVHVYQAAKTDYYLGDADKSGVSTKKTDKFSNVRFLRDSSENLLRWMLSEGYDDHPLLVEVRKVAEASRGHAEHLAGSKRNYEQHNGESGERGRRHSNKRRRWDRGVVDSYRPGN